MERTQRKVDDLCNRFNLEILDTRLARKDKDRPDFTEQSVAAERRERSDEKHFKHEHQRGAGRGVSAHVLNTDTRTGEEF